MSPSFAHAMKVTLIAALVTAFPLVVAAERAETTPARPAALVAPAQGKIAVAFVVTENANVMDIAGAWEVFQDTMVPARGTSMDDQMPFRLFVVSDKKTPVKLTGGMTIVPDYTFEDAPAASVIVVGAQSGSDRLAAYLRARHAAGNVIVSVCTGAFKLALAGLLDGKQATTHHDYVDDFHSKYPNVQLMPGNRYVRSDATVFTAGGLTSGIDLALHIVDLYFGPEVAAKTANYMEHTGTGWKSPEGGSPTADS
ncbi:MAG: GlxA family transcriptional regulator [Rhodanobacteraceae bacterium]